MRPGLSQDSLKDDPPKAPAGQVLSAIIRKPVLNETGSQKGFIDLWAVVTPAALAFEEIDPGLSSINAELQRHQAQEQEPQPKPRPARARWSTITDRSEDAREEHFIDVRTSLSNITSVLEEIQFLRQYLPEGTYHVVSPDASHAALLESQEISFTRYAPDDRPCRG